jgi:hypothetical protein
MVVLVGLGMFLVFFLHLRSVELNVWGAEKFWKIPEYMIYYLSGVWLIDGTIMGVIFISNRAPYWAILIGLLIVSSYKSNYYMITTTTVPLTVLTPTNVRMCNGETLKV